MTRWVNPANATAAAQASGLGMVVLCDLDFSDQTIRVHDGLGPLVFNGNAYQGLGDFATLDVVDESTEIIAKTITLSLSGIPGPLLTEAMESDYQGREVVLYIGPFDVNKMAWYAAPEVIWEGRMDYMTIEIEPGNTKISLRCENRLNREPLVARMTDVDQQLLFPGDTFFNLVWMIPLASTGWGGVTAQYPLNIAPVGRGVTQAGAGGGNTNPFLNKP